MKSSKKKLIRRYIKRWRTILGLYQWKIKTFYHKDPEDILKNFDTGKRSMSSAMVNADWKYRSANIHFNMLNVNELPPAEIEETVVHELVHVLVNEMREDGIHHEERVVTDLTAAFLWTRKYSKKGGKT